MAVDFEVLPPSHQDKFKYDWPNISQELRDNPGKWAVVSAEDTVDTPSAAVSTAVRIKKGTIEGLPRGDYEATARKGRVYARYIKGVDPADL